MRVRWTQRAAARLDEIGSRIARDNPAAADRVVGSLGKRAEALARHPLQGREGRVADTRELVVSGTAYIIVYRVWAETVEVLTLLHSRQAWPSER